MRSAILWLLLGVACAFVLRCSGNQNQSVCGEGDEIALEGQQFCVYRGSIIRETGFRCPMERPFEFDLGDVIICCDDETPNQEILDRARQQYRASHPPDCTDADGDTACEEDDCNDNDPSINPWAEEVTDGVDNDCDGEVDEYDGDDDCTPACGVCEQCVEGSCMPIALRHFLRCDLSVKIMSPRLLNSASNP